MELLKCENVNQKITLTTKILLHLDENNFVLSQGKCNLNGVLIY